MFWILVGIALREEFVADERRRVLRAIGLPTSTLLSATTLVTVALKSRFTIRSSRHFRGITKACRENHVDGLAGPGGSPTQSYAFQSEPKQSPAKLFISSRFSWKNRPLRGILNSRTFLAENRGHSFVETRNPRTVSTRLFAKSLTLNCCIWCNNM